MNDSTHKDVVASTQVDQQERIESLRTELEEIRTSLANLEQVVREKTVNPKMQEVFYNDYSDAEKELYNELTKRAQELEDLLLPIDFYEFVNTLRSKDKEDMPLTLRIPPQIIAGILNDPGVVNLLVRSLFLSEIPQTDVDGNNIPHEYLGHEIAFLIHVDSSGNTTVRGKTQGRRERVTPPEFSPLEDHITFIVHTHPMDAAFEDLPSNADINYTAWSGVGGIIIHPNRISILLPGSQLANHNLADERMNTNKAELAAGLLQDGSILWYSGEYQIMQILKGLEEQLVKKNQKGEPTVLLSRHFDDKDIPIPELNSTF